MALAHALEKLGVPSVILESGTAKMDSTAQRLSDSNSKSLAQAPMRLAVVRGIGGTSRTWGGRCVPFDDLDFAAPPGEVVSPWPCGHEEIRPYYADACEFLGCGPSVFHAERVAGIAGGENLGSMDSLERWSVRPDMFQRHRQWLSRSKSVHLYPGCTVTGFDIGQAARAAGVFVRRNGGQSTTLVADVIVLACGGLENARQLLLLQERIPHIAGGRGGPLGKHYMGHVSGKIANIVFSSSRIASSFAYVRSPGEGFVRRRITISPMARRANGLMNIAFYPDNPQIGDPSHENAILSLVWLALATPFLGSQLLPEAIRHAQLGQRRGVFWHHARNLVRDLPRAAQSLPGLLYGRLLARPAVPGVHLAMPGHRYALHFHGEQAPNPKSMVSLSESLDATGMKRLNIDLRFTVTDALSVVRAHDAVEEWLKETGMGYLEHWYPPDERVARVLESAADGFHQIGLTRMSSDASKGVVDADCRVHGLENIYVAGSSVFPTSGQANPTLLAVALSYRLAGLIAQRHRPVANRS